MHIWTKGKIRHKSISLNGSLLGDHIMKVHKFQIEVMWLFLAVPFYKTTTQEKNGFEQETIVLDGPLKRPNSPIQIRPPPLIATGF